jgi:hypothetical protein
LPGRIDPEGQPPILGDRLRPYAAAVAYEPMATEVRRHPQFFLVQDSGEIGEHIAPSANRARR